MKNLFKKSTLFLAITIALSSFSVSAKVTDPEDLGFDRWPSAIPHWFELSDLEETSSYSNDVLKDFYSLGRLAVQRTLQNHPEWKIYTKRNYDRFGNRIPLSTFDMQVDSYGTKEEVLVGQYYFIFKGDFATGERMIVYPSSTGFGVIYQDKDEKLALALRDEFNLYLREKNIYRYGALELSGQIRFMANVNNFKINWSDLILDKELKNFSKENTTGFLKSYKDHEKLGYSFKKGVLLEGPPGTGKSFVGKVLVSEVLWGDLKDTASVIYISARHLKSNQVIQTLFRVGETLAPTVNFIEDVDLIAFKERDSKGAAVVATEEDAEKSYTLNEFLNALDGIKENPKTLSIATTNEPRDLDPALLRSGRLGLHIHYGYPEHNVRKEFFLRYGKHNADWSPDMTAEWLSANAENMSGADIVKAISVAKQIAYLDGSWSVQSKTLLLTKAHFLEAIKLVRRNLKNSPVNGIMAFDSGLLEAQSYFDAFLAE